MKPPRGPMGAGPILVLMAVLVAVPEVLKRCKPLAKSLGDILVSAGKEVHRMGEVDAPAAPAEGPSARTPGPTQVAPEAAPDAAIPAEPEPVPEAPAPPAEPEPPQTPPKRRGRGSR